jgi:hypothetical protein
VTAVPWEDFSARKIWQCEKMSFLQSLTGVQQTEGAKTKAIREYDIANGVDQGTGSESSR